MKYILAIDLGTSGPKVAFVDEKANIIGYEFEPTPLLLTENGGAEQNPDDWWKAITTAVRRLTDQQLVPVKEVAGICCTAQWSGTVAVNKGGESLMNAIIWMDTRGMSYIPNACKGILNMKGVGISKIFQWARLTCGAPLSGKDSISHILFIKKTCPEIYHQTYKFLEPLDYLNLRLTGEFAASYSSITLHWVTDTRDLNEITYHKKLLHYTGVDIEKLPTLKPNTAILGTLKEDVAQEFGINAGIPVLMGTPDFQSAAIGSGAIDDYQGHLYIGTSSWLNCHLPFRKVDAIHSLGVLPSGIPDRYMITSEQECAGVCLKYLADNIFFPDDDLQKKERPEKIFQKFDHIVENTPAWPKKLIFTPWLYGERSPIDNATIRGGFYNLSLQTKRTDLIRAVFEGVALNSRWLLKYIEIFIHRRMDIIRIVGGGARSDIWCQIFADILDRKIEQVQNPILSNLRGAGILGLVSLGLTTFQEISRHVPVKNTYLPDPLNRALYDELFQEFVEIYKRNKRMYERLNRHTI